MMILHTRYGFIHLWIFTKYGLYICSKSFKLRIIELIFMTQKLNWVKINLRKKIKMIELQNIALITVCLLSFPVWPIWMNPICASMNKQKMKVHIEIARKIKKPLDIEQRSLTHFNYIRIKNRKESKQKWHKLIRGLKFVLYDMTWLDIHFDFANSNKK